MNDLVVLVSSALRDHDPLDPWLTESGWDEYYWDQEARVIAERLTLGLDPSAVRAVIVEVLGELLGSSADGEAGLREQSRRLDLMAATISQALG